MTNPKRSSAILAGALALAMAACGGSSSVSIDDLPGELEAALCSRYARCGYYVSQAACLDDVSLDIAQLKASIAAGRVAYDGNLVNDCIGGLGAASCDNTAQDARVNPAACDQAIRGTVADGGVCFTTQECLSKSCDTTACGMACCAGTCAPTVADAAIGGSCASASCVEGAFCNASEVCTALLAANAACQGNSQCGYGLTCAANVCAASANRGESCAAGGRCNDLGDRCDATSTTCVAKSAIGGACSMGFAGFLDCQQPLVCNQTSLKCENPPAIGATCAFSCANGAFCNDQNTCEAPRANGGACGNDGECASTYCDDNVTPSVCAAKQTCS